MTIKSAMSIMAMIVLLFGPVPLAFSRHGNWHDHYTSADGLRCCDKDCVQATGRLLDQTAEGVTLEVNGAVVVLPPKSVHASEDGTFWICLVGQPGPKASLRSEQIRCAFLATGG